MRCPRCGNENQETNRFCGMCGATLLPTPPGGGSPPQRSSTGAGASAATAAAPPARTAPPRPVVDPPASVSGPSFLGLNDPAPRKRNTLSIDPHSGSRNVDYLLEDDDTSHHGSGGKILVTLILLALAGGFGYLTWKHQGLGWLSSKKTAATAPSTDSAQSSPTDSSPPTQGESAKSDSQPPAAAQPPSKAPENPAPSPNGPAITPDSNATSPSGTANSSPADAAAKSDSDNSDLEKPSAAPAPVAHADKPKRPAPTPPKPHAAVPARAADPVTEARKYLYGRGAAQDCDHGMRILKPAANSGNASAMIEMGALYSAGLCAPHDLPTAYHWFAVALRKDPNNQTAQNDLTKLWSEMTQPERQLAIKLTQ